MKAGSAGIQIKTDDTFPLPFTVPALVTSEFELEFRLLQSGIRTTGFVSLCQNVSC